MYCASLYNSIMYYDLYFLEITIIWTKIEGLLLKGLNHDVDDPLVFIK